ncbi:tyrosine-type recombinase/integrase [Sinorhizobium meliloti]|nr:tyrosine-type recombinase/integrase [Sinorhizobium meliloti]MDX0350226.1 tyrosine-type recombinase/integrase [Sinorhizobium meliloti]
MAKHPDYPYVSSFEDRHGKTRWRFRKSGHKDTVIPGEPHTPEFDATYEAVIGGRPVKADVIPLGGGVRPKSLKHAYSLLKESKEWKGLSLKTRHEQGRALEKLLMREHKGGQGLLGDGLVADLTRKHVKQILGLYDHTPHAQRIILILLMKLAMIALEEEWIASDPTYKLLRQYQPETDGHTPWTLEQMEQYEQRYEIGSPQRVAYALGLWLGNRASDVALLRWNHLVTKRLTIDGEERVVQGFEFVQFKGRNKKKGNAPGPKKVFLPLSPFLEKELAPLSRNTDFVLTSPLTKRGYSTRSLSSRMIEWVRAADLPAGIEAGDYALSMHGLRKSLGIRMAEAGASNREMMDVFGHANPQTSEIYTRMADQARMAVSAMDKVVAAENRRRRANLKVIK